jgi:putative transposase
VIARHRGEHPLTLMCRVLAVSRAGFHAWRTRPRSARAQADAVLRVQIAATHRRTPRSNAPGGDFELSRSGEFEMSNDTVIRQ